MNLRNKIASLIIGLFAINCYAYDGSMIDGHAHWGDSFNEEAVLDRYDKSGIVAQIVMPRYLGVQGDWPTTDERVLEIASRHPGKIFVLAGMQRPDFTYMDWNSPDSNSQAILLEIDKKLQEKKVYGIGEILIRHWAYRNEGKLGNHAEIDKQFDSVFVRQIAKISIKYRVPMVIHMEGYPSLVKQLDTVLNELPNLRLVWAHGCGRSSPDVIRPLLAKHPYLYCDISNMTNTGGYGSGWPNAEEFTSKMETNGVFEEQYKRLILDYPDRFFIGMDVAHQSRWSMEKGNTFEKRVIRTRKLLGTLPEPVAKKLAFENGIAIYQLPANEITLKK